MPSPQALLRQTNGGNSCRPVRIQLKHQYRFHRSGSREAMGGPSSKPAKVAPSCSAGAMHGAKRRMYEVSRPVRGLPSCQCQHPGPFCVSGTKPASSIGSAISQQADWMAWTGMAWTGMWSLYRLGDLGTGYETVSR